MKIELTIPDELIEKIVRGIMDNFPEAGQTMVCTGWKYDTLDFNFEDTEEGKKYKVDKVQLLRAFPLLFSDKWPKGLTQPPHSDQWEAWEDWLGQADAFDFDAFIQLALLGDVIYG